MSAPARSAGDGRRRGVPRHGGSARAEELEALRRGSPATPGPRPRSSAQRARPGTRGTGGSRPRTPLVARASSAGAGGREPVASQSSCVLRVPLEPVAIARTGGCEGDGPAAVAGPAGIAPPLAVVRIACPLARAIRAEALRAPSVDTVGARRRAAIRANTTRKVASAITVSGNGEIRGCSRRCPLRAAACNPGPAASPRAGRAGSVISASVSILVTRPAGARRQGVRWARSAAGCSARPGPDGICAAAGTAAEDGPGAAASRHRCGGRWRPAAAAGARRGRAGRARRGAAGG
jgi:hypothetical protein